MKKKILFFSLMMFLCLSASIARAEFNYDAFDSLLSENIKELLKYQTALMTASIKAGQEEKSTEVERCRNLSVNIADMRGYLQGLKQYRVFRQLIASDKIDEFENMLRKDINQAQGRLNFYVRQHKKSIRFYNSMKLTTRQTSVKITHQLQALLKQTSQRLDGFKTEGTEKVDLSERCPYCDREYGKPVAGGEEKDYKLRREHEVACKRRLN